MQHNCRSPITETTLKLFGVAEMPKPLTGGTATVYKAGNLIFKQITQTSFENDHSPELLPYIFEKLTKASFVDVRVSTPVLSNDGRLITAEGWTAWSYEPGVHASRHNVHECIAAIQKFHLALKGSEKSPYLETNRTPWGVADEFCWGEKPVKTHPLITDLIAEMYSIRHPIEGLRNQLIHADLNLGNILIQPASPPALIDVAPFWRPPEFALAIFANFIGPRTGDVEVLEAFKNIQEFDQLLLRAGIRMLLIAERTGGFEGWEESPEKLAAKLIIEHVKSNRSC